jgi:transposase
VPPPVPSTVFCRARAWHLDVPPKLSARTRVFATGQGPKTDATDAHSVALAATRMPGLRRVVDDQQLAVLVR